ncbi:RNA polymerase subunit sigma-24, partial [Streptomyces sp. NPDC007074]
MYSHVGVDASGLATLRATVLDRLRGFVPTAYAVPAFAFPAPVGPCYALADGSAAVGRRGRSGSAATPTARRPAADSDSARMMDLVERAQAGEADA